MTPSGIELTNISDGNPYIEVSGLPAFADEIRWPFGSGVDVEGNVGFAKDLDARLSDLQATFGFNQTPHRFNMTWVPVCFEFDTAGLPNIGDEIDFTISAFRVKGRIVHTDIQKSTGGIKYNITVEDLRSDLNRIVLDTFGLFDTHQDPDENIIDVHHWFLTEEGGTTNPRALRMLREHGATYQQIYDAVGFVNAEAQSFIPSPSVFQENVGDASRFRFSFRTTPLLDAIVKIFTDASFDLYWHMAGNYLQHVNRKKQIDLSLNDIPFSENGQPESISVKFGKDEPERPTAVQVIGDRMEGVVGRGPLAASNGGTYASAGGAVNLSLSTDYRFKPAWQGATVFYFGEDGSIREDSPSDEELSAAMKGIEFWAQKKSGNFEQHMDSRLEDRGIDPITGRQVPIVSPVSASGVGLIQNRGQEGRSWIIEWYNRVRNFAQNHYTRSYFLDTGGLKDDLEKFDIVDAAWCGLENQAPAFNTGYKINDTFKHLAPFWDETDNKLRAWATIPKSNNVGGKAPLWGADGRGVPTQFDQWTETDTRVFVPIEVTKWDRSSSKFNSDFILRPMQSDEGLMIRFPNTMWESYEEDDDLVRLPKIRYMRSRFTAETASDSAIDPATAGLPYTEFVTGINIPVKVIERYGTNKPEKWSAGFSLDQSAVKRVKAEVIQRDELAPWNFEPHDIKDSVSQMNEEGKSIALGRVVNRSEATFIEATKVGLPIIAFDQYADSDGSVDHGVSNLSVTKNISSWWQTRYGAKTHFPQPVKLKPVPQEVMEDFRFALHRINERFNRPRTAPPIQPPNIFDPKTEDEQARFLHNPIKESFKIPVIITELVNITNSAGDPDVAYVGEDSNGVVWPVTMRQGIRNSLSSTSKLGLNQHAFAIDGFLQLGMQATFNYEDQDDGSFVHYFTGGVQLREARMAAMLESPRQIDGNFRADVEIEGDTLQVEVPNSDPKEFRTVTLEPITLRNVLFSDQQNVDQTLRTTDKVLISGAGQENGNVVKPTFDGTTYSIDMNAEPQKDKILILTSGRAGTGVLFGTITRKPDLTTGRNAALQTISQVGGTAFSDGDILNANPAAGNAGTQYFIDIVGVEFNQVAIGDPCIVTQESEQDDDGTGPRVIRLITFINKPLFMATDAFGGTV